MACQVGHCKQQVTQLVLQPRPGRAGVDLVAQLGQFLVDLLQHRFRPRPVETDPRRSPLQLHRPDQGRQPQGDTVQHAVAGLPAGASGGDLVRLPGRLAPGLVEPGAGEDMRMASLQLVADGGHHITEVEPSLLLCDTAQEHHLQQQVAQLVAQLLRFAAGHRIRHLVGLLEGVRNDAL